MIVSKNIKASSIYNYAKGRNINAVDERNVLESLDKRRLVGFLKRIKRVSRNQPNAKGTRFWIKEGNTDFTCKLRRAKCCALKKNGTPCSRRVVQGIFVCFQHVTKIFRIRIDQSGIVFNNKRMQGLFACDPTRSKNSILFRKGDEICPYFGEILTKTQLDNRYPGDVTAPYALRINNNKFIDSACFMSIGAKGNKPPTGRSAMANASLLEVTGNTDIGRIVAKKNIRNGSEIFLSYGRTYKFSNSGIKPSQRIVKKKRSCGR